MGLGTIVARGALVEFGQHWNAPSAADSNPWEHMTDNDRNSILTTV